MDALTLLRIFDAAYLLATVAWLGAILFFSFGVAPIIFKVLEPSQAARFVRALFPRYYAWGAIAATAALASFTSGVLVTTGVSGAVGPGPDRPPDRGRAGQLLLREHVDATDQRRPRR